MNSFYLLKDTSKVQKIFDGWQDTMIDSCLQKVMGVIYVDDYNDPQTALAKLGDFAFLAGKVNKKFLDNIYLQHYDFVILVPQNKEWEKAIEQLNDQNTKKITRYAIKKEKDIFDETYLESIVAGLSKEYMIRPIDKELFQRCRENSWSRDLVSQYDDYEMYKKLGIGFVILKDDIIVSGASSYSRYLEGIEIEIDTCKEYRRQGLALVVAAKLILECLKRESYPSWDAHNKASLALASKLGYHFDHEYIAYEITMK